MWLITLYIAILLAALRWGNLSEALAGNTDALLRELQVRAPQEYRHMHCSYLTWTDVLSVASMHREESLGDACRGSYEEQGKCP